MDNSQLNKFLIPYYLWVTLKFHSIGNAFTIYANIFGSFVLSSNIFRLFHPLTLLRHGRNTNKSYSKNIIAKVRELVRKSMTCSGQHWNQ